jgi:hypothetical protein
MASRDVSGAGGFGGDAAWTNPVDTGIRFDLFQKDAGGYKSASW